MSRSKDSTKLARLAGKVVIGLSIAGSIASIIPPLFGGEPRWPVFFGLVSAAVIVALYLLTERFCGSAIPEEERRRHAHFLAMTTDPMSRSSSPRRTALACYAIEVTHTEEFHCELVSLKDRLTEFHRDAITEYEHSQRAIAQFRKIIDELLRDCVFLESHHTALKYLCHESCGRSEAWNAVRTSFREFRTGLQDDVLRPLAQASRKEGVSASLPRGSRADRSRREQERRRTALRGSATCAQQLIRTRLDFLLAEVGRLRTETRRLLHETL
jgi:hypothetical protein